MRRWEWKWVKLEGVCVIYPIFNKQTVVFFFKDRSSDQYSHVKCIALDWPGFEIHHHQRETYPIFLIIPTWKLANKARDNARQHSESETGVEPTTSWESSGSQPLRCNHNCQLAALEQEYLESLFTSRNEMKRVTNLDRNLKYISFHKFSSKLRNHVHKI